MDTASKTKEQLATELIEALDRVAELEALEAEREQALMEAQRRASQTALIYEVGQRVSGELQLDELLSAVATIVCNAFDYTGVMLLLRDEGTEHLRLKAIAGACGDIFSQDIQFTVGEGMIGYAAATGEFQVSGDVSQDPHYLHGPYEGIRSELAVPIKIRHRVIGVLDLQSDRPNAFDEIDVTAMEALGSQIATAIENARLLNDANRRTRRLAIVNRIAQAASATVRLDDLLEVVYEQIEPVFQPDAFFIALYDQDTNEMDVCFHIDEGIRQPREQDLLRGLSSIVISKKKPLIIRDFENEPEYQPFINLTGTGRPAASWLGAPLLIGERVIGIINVQSYYPYAYAEEDEQLLFTIADQVAVALEKARLFQEHERQAQEMKAINQVGQIISSVLDLDTVLRQIVDTTKDRFGHYFVLIALVEGERLVFRSGSTVGDSETRIPPGEIGVSLKQGPSLIVEAVRTEKPVLVNDVLNDPRYFAMEEIPDTRSELSLPIQAKGRVIGVLDVQSDRPFAYAQGDVDVLSALANQAGVAIDNARLFEEALARAEESAVLNDLGQALTTRLTVDEVLEEAYRQTSRLVDTTHFYIGLYDPDEHEITFCFNISESEIDREITVMSADEGLAGHIVRSRTSVLFEENVEERVRALGIDVVGAGAQSWLGVPMIVGDKVLGVMAVQSHTTPRLYGEHERELLMTIASQVAIALQNAQMVEGLERMVEERTVELRTSLEERERLQQEVIDAQRQTLQELSTPVIPIMNVPDGSIIAMPLVGNVDTMRARDITRALLAGIRKHEAKVVIIDITGVPVVDSGVASYLNKTIQAARLKGARTIITGISEAVAETIVDLGIDWGGVETLSDLQTGLIVALNSVGVRLTRR